MSDILIVMFLVCVLLLLVGLVNPRLIYFWAPPEKRKRWKLLLFFGISGLILLYAIGSISEPMVQDINAKASTSPIQASSPASPEAPITASTKSKEATSKKKKNEEEEKKTEVPEEVKAPTLEDSIIGHWQNLPDENLLPEENTTTDYYISKNKLIMTEPGKYREMKVEVIKTDEKKNAIAMKLISEENSHITVFVFDDASRKSFTERIDISKIKILSDDEAQEDLKDIVDLLDDDKTFEQKWVWMDSLTTPKSN